ncbi:hypothetical protein BHM03_00030118 [Ensete ventricosum]|nr:hypothetical protein BHM03_00030118 [Ensete ventricosum]
MADLTHIWSTHYNSSANPVHDIVKCRSRFDKDSRATWGRTTLRSDASDIKDIWDLWPTRDEFRSSCPDLNKAQERTPPTSFELHLPLPLETDKDELTHTEKPNSADSADTTQSYLTHVNKIFDH